jgi:hypothetical protein
MPEHHGKQYTECSQKSPEVVLTHRFRALGLIEHLVGA